MPHRLHSVAIDQSSAYRSKRGRPTAGQSEAISRGILDSAASIFLDLGYQGASMEAIAAKAGIPKSTLYKRFPDKLLLLRAVLTARLSAWEAVASRKNWMLTGELEQRLKFYANAILTWSMSPDVRAFSLLAASAWSGVDDAGERLHVIGYTHMIDILERDIREFGPESQIEAKEPRIVAEALMAMLFGWRESRSAQVHQADMVAFGDQAVELLLYGKNVW